MEQRIDSNTQPEFAAGTDPAYIPGLTAPAPARTEADAEAVEAAPEDVGEPDALTNGAVGPEAAADAVEGAEPVARAVTAADPVAPDAAVAEAAEDVAEPAGDVADADPAGKAAADGPVFEVSDRRGSIRVDADGVRFRLDDQEAEFDWAEIGAVEVRTGRFGRRFTVTVHLSSRRWFNAEVEAEARGRLKEWTAELDAALDAHFEEA
ncbi:hypothetical protein ABZ119_19540 [Streptomyces sp. NPDC006288]|uniref:hypothetical protein n=1 Tax=Streptomyces sp. NPDC006288 TaxID=3156743 RepID=UPI0033AE11D3